MAGDKYIDPIGYALGATPQALIQKADGKGGGLPSEEELAIKRRMNRENSDLNRELHSRLSALTRSRYGRSSLLSGHAGGVGFREAAVTGTPPSRGTAGPARANSPGSSGLRSGGAFFRAGSGSVTRSRFSNQAITP